MQKSHHYIAAWRLQIVCMSSANKIRTPFVVISTLTPAFGGGGYLERK